MAAYVPNKGYNGLIEAEGLWTFFEAELQGRRQYEIKQDYPSDGGYIKACVKKAGWDHIGRDLR